jgi:RHS repeat-associated protein
VVAADVAHFAFGQGVAAFTRGNGHSTTIGIDSLGRRQSIEGDSADGGAGVPISIDYSPLDPRGDVTQVVESGDVAISRTLTYDDWRRVTSVSGLGSDTESYVYDTTGNRLQKYRLFENFPTTYHYDTNPSTGAALNHLLRKTVGQTPVVGAPVLGYYYYDGEGDVTGLYAVWAEAQWYPPPAQIEWLYQAICYVYDAERQLVRVENSSGTLPYTGTLPLGSDPCSLPNKQPVASFAYDHLGRRIFSGWSTAATYSVYGRDGELLGEFQPSGSPAREYMYLDGEPFLQRASDGSLRYYHNDRVGTPIRMTDGSGQTVWRGDFGPFGEPVGVEGPSTNPLRFLGQTDDELYASTGLPFLGVAVGPYYNVKRYYDPSTGRYLQPDPLLTVSGVPASGNSFEYAGSDPLAFVDPSGMSLVLRAGTGFEDACAQGNTWACILGTLADMFKPRTSFQASSMFVPTPLAMAPIAEEALVTVGGQAWRVFEPGEVACQSGCEAVAESIQKAIGGEIVTIRPLAGECLGPVRNAAGEFVNPAGEAGGWAFHQFVVQGGQIFDALTGPLGQEIAEYQARWLYADAIAWGF